LGKCPGPSRWRPPRYWNRPPPPWGGRLNNQELPDDEQQESPVPARGVQCPEQSDLGRSEHQFVECELRQNHQHQNADARDTARPEICLLISIGSVRRQLSTERSEIGGKRHQRS